MYKEIAPLGMVGGTSILPKGWFLRDLREEFNNFTRLNSGEDGTTRGKAKAVAFVSGFSPLRGMKKI
ncbi:hypothetical protein [Paenibacillus stellifer]|uniref:hypothetical protein n=1 Tax=Paenibacillus stellifer TaxID=169760 RepID=UPI000AC67722|nr:hypothetical protein [Paenibacillus stellifer]